MGQAMKRLKNESSLSVRPLRRFPSYLDPKQKFPDLQDLPPELGLMILANLNATDLCLAMCVNEFWRELANDDLLWQGLCRATWGCVSAYERKNENNFSFRKLYMQLDEHSLTFNTDAALGIQHLVRDNLIEDTPLAIARFIHSTNRLDRWQVREFLTGRHDVLDEIIKLDSYTNQMLPNALRSFFSNIQSPVLHGGSLQPLLEKFAERFISCNPNCGLTRDGICILCYSLILLSVDLTSPHVKNKMSKREFIRNVRHATPEASDDLSGDLYDNIYLVGHIAPQKW